MRTSSSTVERRYSEKRVATAHHTKFAAWKRAGGRWCKSILVHQNIDLSGK